MARESRLILAPPSEAGRSSGSASSAGSRVRAVLAAGVGPVWGACRSSEDFYFIVMKRVS